MEQIQQKAIEMREAFGVRWLDTAFNFECNNAFEGFRAFEIQSGVKPPHSKRFA